MELIKDKTLNETSNEDFQIKIEENGLNESKNKKDTNDWTNTKDMVSFTLFIIPEYPRLVYRKTLV